MSGRTTLLVILALIATGLGYLKYRAGSMPVPTPSSTPSMSPSPSDETLRWSEFSTEYFSLKYPPEASASAFTSGIDSHDWRITYMGNLQRESGRTQTELWDGYAITITRFESVGENPVESQATTDREGIVEGCGEEEATPLGSSSLGSIQTVSFEGGCLGSAQYHYFVHENALYRVTNMVAQPEEQKLDYQDITMRILSTISLE